MIYDFDDQHRNAAHVRGRRRLRAAVLPDGKSVAFVRGRHRAARRRRRFQAGTGAGQGNHRRHRRRRRPSHGPPTAAGSPTSPPATRGFTNVSIVAAAGGEGRQVSFLANANANAITWSPDGTFLVFDTGQRTEADRARARRPDAAHAEIPRGSVPRPVQRGEHAGQSTGPHGAAAASGPAEGRTARPSEGGSASTGETIRRIRRPRAASRPQSPWRSSSRTSGGGSRWCRPGSTSAGPSSAPMARPRCLIAGAAGQQNLYSYSLDELARERPVARQLTTTAGRKSRRQLLARQQGSVLPGRRADPGGDAWRTARCGASR